MNDTVVSVTGLCICSYSTCLLQEGMIDPPPFNPATATVTAETPFTLSPELASLVASMTGGQPPSSQAPPQSQPPPSQGTVAANMERILSSLMVGHLCLGECRMYLIG